MTLASRHKRELAVLAAYLLLLLTLLVVRPDYFRRQFLDTTVSAAPVLLVAIGMTLVLVARQIDISVGSQLSACAVLGALAAQRGLPVAAVVPIAIAAGALMGAANGLLVAYARLPSIVVTLAMMVVLEKSMELARGGAAVQPLPANFQWLGLDKGPGEALLIATAAVVFVVAAWAARNLAAARAVYAVGSDPEAARLAGVRPARVVFGTFVLTGGLVGLAAALMAVREPQVATNLGAGLEMQVIAAVVVGGTAITGGRGTMFGTLVGVLLLGSVRPTLSFLGLPADWDRAAQGAIILLAVASEGLLGRGARGAGRPVAAPA